ncbi:CRISPR-associated protein, Csn1 family [Schleiferilactobacillus harbinensis DSM 16991]|uniref:CRISPR-associated endonuclease Cas9 n=2 Tax=Schleiferilactobacillus harbinensis TaxID=304207 RepID=A0A0R1XK13_9LACO|nr:CRISPR-associated protein, Csn1 family [Schleiferilactobacillus harbinensis DSM 16991]
MGVIFLYENIVKPFPSRYDKAIMKRLKGRQTMGYILSLDIGIASCGYSVLETDALGVPYKIKTLNSIIFTRAENPKTGASLAEPRRKYRGARRRKRRTSFRKHRTRQLFITSGLLSKQDIARYLNQQEPHDDIWELRVKGLDEPLTNLQLFQVLYYFVTHRGFKSNRKAELKDKDIGPVLNSINAFKEEMQSHDYRTIGELYANDPRFRDRKHNKDYTNGFLGTIQRSWLVDEIKMLLTNQQSFGNTQLTSEFIELYLNIFTSQRNFDDGPASGPYSGDLIDKMVGPDTFNRSRKRAPRATYTFQYFSFLSKLNSLRIAPSISAPFETLTVDQRALITKRLWGPDVKSADLKFKQIRMVLSLPETARFNLVNYGNTPEKALEIEDKTTFISIKPLREIEKALTGTTLPVSHDQLDAIARILTVYKSDSNRKTAFHNQTVLSDEVIEQLLPLNFSKFGHLSVETMQEIIPYLEQGMVYSDAATAAGYDFRNNQIDMEYIRDNVTNPVVRRAVSVANKLVKAVVRRYGKPDSIHIELARDLSQNFQERRQDEVRQQKNARDNEKIAKRLEELGIPVNGVNITKMKLYDEQHGIDLYDLSTNASMAVTDIFSDDRYEIDHIIPYSVSFDDSYTNKVLVSAKANREKRDRIPMEVFGNDSERRRQFENRVNTNITNLRKKRNLLKETFSDEDKAKWKSRNINDTRYLNRILMNYLSQNVEFTDVLSDAKHVIALNGAVTAKIRSRWGITKVRAAGDLHHAVDAVVIGCVTDALIQAVTRYAKYQERRDNKAAAEQDLAENNPEELDAKQFRKVFNDYPLPWPEFREELMGRVSSDPSQIMAGRQWSHYTAEEISELKQPFVVRVPNHRIVGPATLDTVYGQPNPDDGLITQRVRITDLKPQKNKDGEDIIKAGANVYELAADGGNKLVYESILDALQVAGGDGKKAFPTGRLLVRSPIQDIPVERVRVTSKATLVVPVGPKSVAANGSMVRIDVYKTPKKYVFVPIYVRDTVKAELPDRAVAPVKPYSQWYQLQPKDQFLFSLFANDLIRFKHPRGVSTKEILTDGSQEKGKRTDVVGYFTGADIATASIAIEGPDRSFSARGIGFASLKNVEKLTVNYFGELHSVHETQPMQFRGQRG